MVTNTSHPANSLKRARCRKHPATAQQSITYLQKVLVVIVRTTQKGDEVLPANRKSNRGADSGP